LQNFEYDQDFGGVFYVFVRGVRAYQTTGIFYAKPSLNKLKQLAAAVGATFDF
jgi:exodeoxyribonuclease V beta subunit